VIACSLPPLIDMHVSYYDDGLRWLINDDGYIIVLMLIYFTVMIVYLNDDGYLWPPLSGKSS
jgi:hypothetical protein